MKLPAYNIDIRISDPDDPGTELKTRIERVPREKILNTPFPLKNQLELLEEMLDGGEENGR